MKLIAFALICIYSANAEPLKAKAVLRNPANGIDGVITFEETQDGILIHGNITGLKGGPHGFHVHEKGDVSKPDCTSAGPHFNPYKKMHGAPKDQERHVGDLGNIDAVEGEKLIFTITDDVISLKGDNSIVGRSIVIHADPDDYGRGTFEDSTTTGHAGARLACGVIEKNAATGLITSFSLSLLFLPLLLITRL